MLYAPSEEGKERDSRQILAQTTAIPGCICTSPRPYPLRSETKYFTLRGEQTSPKEPSQATNKQINKQTNK